MRPMDVQCKNVQDSLPSAPPLAFDSEALDLNSRIKTQAERLIPTLAENIQLKCFFAAGLPSRQMDRTDIQEILLNVFLLATGALPGGGILSIQTQGCTSEDDQHSRRHIVLTVQICGDRWLDDGARVDRTDSRIQKICRIVAKDDGVVKISDNGTQSLGITIKIGHSPSLPSPSVRQKH